MRRRNHSRKDSYEINQTPKIPIGKEHRKDVLDFMNYDTADKETIVLLFYKYWYIKRENITNLTTDDTIGYGLSLLN